MKKTLVVDIVGLSRSLIGSHTPFLEQWLKTHHCSFVQPMLPAVTTAVQSTYLTGLWPKDHGIVGNGWYDREECDIKFWKQSNKLVHGEKIWERAKREDPTFSCAQICWWYNMYADVDYSVTPRPQYHADGVKLPDCYTHPQELRDVLQSELGTFPLFHYWGPGADIRSSAWIARAAMKVDAIHDPTLTLVYLPHLDYCLQKFGPRGQEIPEELRRLDAVVQELVGYFERQGADVLLLSEYGITEVHHPIHINRLLREHGYLRIREEQGLELLDPGASPAFAVSDHQIAHVYVQPQTDLAALKRWLKQVPGIAEVLDQTDQEAYHVHHERSGDLLVLAEPDSWFTYYYWLEDRKAPDFARTVEIHRKPGYDPVEMFMSSKIRAAYKLLRKKLGFRYRMDVIPLDAGLIRGSHGLPAGERDVQPLVIGSDPKLPEQLEAPDVYQVIWNCLNRNS